ncbi:transient receptor potential cation channel subfamily M member-like 2 [Littorina saxatilis]|uniref:transient receptor potential cation channel subfamily M member-like 2 n=1 Tax=Littorina saxatilis TaxID=31220 RepID=UPI0038B4357C
MKEVWQMMTDDDHWRLPLPKLLISVTGEAKTLTPHPRVKAILKQGLVNAAANTGAWIITGGRATGMMKMVGEAVSEYADATGNQTGQELVVLGIVSLGCVANRHLFKEKALQKNGRKPLTYIMPGEMSDSHCAPLDHNHTHFLLVDDGTERQPGGEIDFRSDLEKYISTQKKDSQAQNLKVNQQVSLAMAWQHCDIAKQCIFSSENRCNWQEADLSSSMLDALVEDQADFVQLFLDLGLDLERFLCVETLWQLYSKCLAKSAVAKELLTYSSSRITSTATTTQYEVGLDLKDNPHLLFDISKVIVHLLKDNSFNFYSDFHVLGEGFQYPSFKHPERELFLWSILFNRRDLAQIVWKDGLDHIGGALCARALLKEMSVIAEEMEMAEFSEDLAKHSVEWEAHALTVLAECYSRDHLLTHNLLVRELRHWAPEESALLCTSDTAGHPAHTNTPDTAGRPTPLSMTESYEMTDFAGHSACQTKLTDIWNGGLAGNTSIWKVRESLGE